MNSCTHSFAQPQLASNEEQRKEDDENRIVVALKLRNFRCACNWTITAVCCMSRQHSILIPQLNPVPSRQWKQDEIVDKHKMRIRKVSKKGKQKPNGTEWEMRKMKGPISTHAYTHARRARAIRVIKSYRSRVNKGESFNLNISNLCPSFH